MYVYECGWWVCAVCGVYIYVYGLCSMLYACIHDVVCTYVCIYVCVWNMVCVCEQCVVSMCAYVCIDAV